MRGTGKFTIDPPVTSHKEWQAIKKFCEEEHKDGPSRYCDLMISEDGASLSCTTFEPRALAEWTDLLIERFFKQNHTIHGIIRWMDEGYGEVGAVEVEDNRVMDHSWGALKKMVRYAIANPDQSIIALQIIQDVLGMEE